jgi:hypothetical protein
MTQEFAWIGDGLGREQIGRAVNIDGQTGVVINGSDLFIEVRFDRCNWLRKVLRFFRKER